MAGFDHSWPSELVLNRTSFWWSMWPAEINSGLVAMIIVMLVVSGGDGGDVAVWSYLVLLMGHKDITETSDQVLCGYGACYIRTLKDKSALETKLLWSLLPYFPMSQTTRVFRRCLTEAFNRPSQISECFLLFLLSVLEWFLTLLVPVSKSKWCRYWSGQRYKGNKDKDLLRRGID